MNLEDLKRITDFFFENANRYGRADAQFTQVGVIMEDGKTLIPLLNAMIDPNYDPLKLVFVPAVPLNKAPEEPVITQEEQSEIDKLRKSLRISEALSAEMRAENKKLKKKIEKLERDGHKEAVKDGPAS